MTLDFEAGAKADAFAQPICHQIWEQKYQYVSGGTIVDHDTEDTWRRVAKGLAKAERAEDRSKWEKRFFDALNGFRLLPGGRILSGCGTSRDVTLFNTFVMRTIPDSVDGIMDTMKDAARTMQMGGGIGFDFSTIRPAGSMVKGLDCPAAGPIAIMEIGNAICGALVTGMGRGAMMATLRCDHPDIEAFIFAKSKPGRLQHFNISVLASDRFMNAVQSDGAWQLVWDGQVEREIGARQLWRQIMECTFASAEPGVLFIDRINKGNPLSYIETIAATNSCAEQPLPANGACPLASINLSRLIAEPFLESASFDEEELHDLATVAVRMLDNVIDISRYPIPAQKWEAANKRRIGVGVTGLADALIMLGTEYGSDKGTQLVGRWMRLIQNAAYKASAHLAAERGTFPMYQAALHLAQPTVRKLEPDVRRAIAASGLRNGVLTTIAPTGTISMFAGNVSSGIEPVFSPSFKRKIKRADGTVGEEAVQDYAALLFHRSFGTSAKLPACYITATELAPEAHVRMQAAAQEWVDSGISKTVNCPEDISFEDFEHIYLEAYAQGCKGCTTYRPNPITGSILSV